MGLGSGIRDLGSRVKKAPDPGSGTLLMLCCAGQSAGPAAAPLPGYRDREQGSQASAPAQRGQKRAEKFHRWVLTRGLNEVSSRLSWLSNIALVHESKCGGEGGLRGPSQ
jgi:hypothetical protein